MRKILTILFLSLFVAAFSQTNNFWTKKSDFGAFKRERAVGFAINGKGYVGTGIDTTETVQRDWWEYDAVLDTWTQKANLPGSVRRNAVGFPIGNKGYVGMGIDSTEAFTGTILSDFWEYNPQTNTWTQKASYPGYGGGGVYFATGFELDNKGFVCCGKVGADLYIDEFWEYKPLSDTWIQRSDFPGGERYQLCSFVVNGKAYVGLGAEYNTYLRDIWEYQTATDTWIRKADFAGGDRGSVTTFVISQRAFVCLGVDGGLKKDLWEYDPFLDTWTARASFDGSERKGAVGFAINGKGYAGTGDGYNGKKASFYEYTPVAVVGVADYESSESIDVFPNPVNDHFTIQSVNNDVQSYNIVTLDGKVVENIPLNGTATIRVEREEIASGVYLLIGNDREGNMIATQKIIFR